MPKNTKKYTYSTILTKGICQFFNTIFIKYNLYQTDNCFHGNNMLLHYLTFIYKHTLGLIKPYIKSNYLFQYSLHHFF